MSTPRRSCGPMQAMVVVVPSSFSHQFRTFCEFNKGFCPLLYDSRTGDTTAGHLARESDIRTALGSYFVLKDGKDVIHASDLKQFPWSDMVTFYIGSVSHCVERSLWDAGILIESMGRKHSTPVFITTFNCSKTGPFCSSMVVSMHLIPKEHLEETIAVTAHLKDILGTPIHIGDPSVLGIKDVHKPDYGDPPDMQDKIPVFWASGVVAHLAVRSAGLPLAFTDDMENLFVCDASVEGFTERLPFDVDTRPRVVTIKEKPFIASLLSENALRRIRSLESEIQEDLGRRGIAKLHIPDELVKAALVLSHSRSVAVHFGFPCNTNKEFPDETDGPPGFIAICKALNALGKKVTCVANSYQVNLVRELVRKFLSSDMPVLEFNPTRIRGSEGIRLVAQEFLFDGGTSPRFDALVAIEATSRTKEGCYMTMKGRDLIDLCIDGPVDELFIQAHKSGKIATIGIGDGGNEIGMGKVRHLVIRHIDNGPKVASIVCTDQLITAGVSNWGGSALAAALFILRQCPAHSVYARRGKNKERAVSFDEVLNGLEKEEEILSYLGEMGLCDGISPSKKMSVDDLPFDPVHKRKLQKLLTIAAPSRQSNEKTSSSLQILVENQ